MSGEKIAVVVFGTMCIVVVSLYIITVLKVPLFSDDTQRS